MNVAFFIGNGFDLQLGLKTGYKSFLEWYTKLDSDDQDIQAFREYLQLQPGEWWSDAEVAMGQYLEGFTDETIAIYFKNIRDFKLRLSEYLSYENLKYHCENDIKVIESFRDFMLKSADDVMPRPRMFRLNEERKKYNTLIHFVTFNYTDALDRILKKTKQKYGLLDASSNILTGDVATKIGKVYHIHGTLTSSLVMGVDNSGQLSSSNITNLSKLSRTLIKPIVNDELGRSDHEDAISMLRDCNYLFFYGLSFGITDKTWWDLVKKKLINDNHCQAVIFSRSTNNEIQTIIPEDVLDYTSDKIDEFLKKMGIEPSSDHYDIVRKKVFVIRNTQRLNISIKDREVAATV